LLKFETPGNTYMPLTIVHLLMKGLQN